MGDKGRVVGDEEAMRVRLAFSIESLHRFHPSLHLPLIQNLVPFHKKHGQYPRLNSRLCQVPFIVPRIALGSLAILSRCHCLIKYPKLLTCSYEHEKVFYLFYKIILALVKSSCNSPLVSAIAGQSKPIKRK
jgi:hypothetical protein